MRALKAINIDVVSSASKRVKDFLFMVMTHVSMSITPEFLIFMHKLRVGGLEEDTTVHHKLQSCVSVSVLCHPPAAVMGGTVEVEINCVWKNNGFLDSLQKALYLEEKYSLC